MRKKIRALKLTKLKICSAGIHANVGDPPNEKTLQTLRNKGIKGFRHEAQKLDKKLVEESLAIVCMTDKQRDFLMELRWQIMREAGEEEVENNVYSFSEIAGYEVIDPYGRDLDCYGYVFELLNGGMDALITKLLPPETQKKFIQQPRKKKE